MSEARTDTDSKLIELSKQYTRGYGNKDVTLGKFEALLSEDVVYKADTVTLSKDIKGRKDVLAYIQQYFESYDYDQAVCFGAVNADEKIAFNLVVDRNVTPKKGAQPEQHGKGEVKPSHTINLTALQFDRNDQISEIYPARQLSVDEAHRKLKQIPDYAGSSFNPEKIAQDESPEPSDQRRQLLQSLAGDWNKLFTTNEVALADKICSPDIKVHALLESQQITGLDAWKKALAEVFKEWECKDNRSRIAVTAGNKAFILWETKGIAKGKESNVWGITLLIVGDDKITEAASIYAPFPGQREALVKDA